MLPKRTDINNYATDLKKDKQPPHESIYNLGPLDLEILKTYLETNLTHGFMRPSKSPAKTPIFLMQKLDGSLRLYVNYQGLNNLTIKKPVPISSHRRISGLVRPGQNDSQS